MKKTMKLFVAILLIAGFSSTLMAQVTLTGNTAGATLVTALTIANTTPLNFGVIAIPATAGTVAMNTAGLRSPTGCTIVLTGTPSTVALFTVGGTASDNYTLTLPTSINVITAGGGGAGLINEMIIDNIVVNVDGTGEAAYTIPISTPALSGLGVSTFLVAGTLNIKALQTLGVYAGVYTVVVDYF
jgi:hypothetical protein